MFEVEEKERQAVTERRPRLVAVIPAYNEERFIGSVVLKACKHVDQVIVVDDGSQDETVDIAQAAGAEVIRHDQNRGKGVALNSGLRRALILNADVIVVLDGDGQHFPEEMPAVLAPVLDGQADIVVGSRYLGGDGAVPRHRVLGHWAFTSLTNLTSGVRVTDSQSGFRAFSRRAVEAMRFSSNGFSVESEMQFLAHERKLRLVEVPITADYMEKPKRPVVTHGLLVLNGLLRMVGQYRPLLFFGLPGLILLLAGLAWGWWVVDIYRRAEELAVGYALISVLLTIMGSLGLFAGVILHSVRGLLLDLVRDPEAESGSDATLGVTPDA